jgi:hypothetical protein
MRDMKGGEMVPLIMIYHRSGEYWSATRREPLTLLRGEELSTKSGIGGVIARLGGDGLLDLDWMLAARSRVKLLAWWREGGPTAL